MNNPEFERINREVNELLRDYNFQPHELMELVLLKVKREHGIPNQ